MCCVNSVLEINYQKQFMKIHSTIDSLYLNDFSKISFTFKNDRILIPISVMINDTLTIHGDFLVDMGMGGALALAGTVSNKYDLENVIPEKIFSYSIQGGVGGETKEYLFQAKSCSLGKFSFNSVLTGLGIDSTGNTETKKYTGMLGNGLLERFDVVIDFANKNLYLKPNSDFSKPFKFNRLGFTYSDRTQTKGGWIVNGFDKNSNAEKSGLLINDRIISINKVPVNEIPFENQKHFFDEFKNFMLQVERNNNTLEINFYLKPATLDLLITNHSNYVLLR